MIDEGRYRLEDIKMAVKEDKRGGIATFALAFDPKTGPSLPHMFGRSNSQIIKQLDPLPLALGIA